jgi:hypothetical protein
MSGAIMKSLLFLLALVLLLAAPQVRAADCTMQDRTCVIEMLKASADKIERTDWRDQTYRELAKTMAFEGDADGAITIIDKIEGWDTKAMTIRGIGMATADRKLSKDVYDPIFKKLRTAADTIKDPPSFAIALTYIAMSQAFAGDDEGAWATAAEMENESLRNKAYGETGEIQAERGHFDAAMKSISFISTASYKNKAYTTVSKILADGKNYDQAFQAASAIANPYEQTSALQYVLDAQRPREIPHQ